MVDERAAAGVGETVRGVCGGERKSVGGVGGPVWRLCGVAAGVSAGGSAGAGDEVLARGVGWRRWRRGAGVSWRPGAASGAKSSGRSSEVQGRGGSERAVAGVEPARGSDAVYDVAGGISVVAVAAERAGRDSGGDGGSGADASGVGRADRVVCKHVGDSDRGQRERGVSGVVGAGAGEVSGSLRAPGVAVWAVGGRAAAGAVIELSTAVSGDVSVAEAGGGTVAAVGGPGGERVWARRSGDGGEVRPEFGDGGARRGTAGSAEL